MTFYEKHCEDFYKYLVRNERQIKQEVRKNITYEEELFEEAYSDTIVKVANAILVNHKLIEDFRYYFFISFKQNYIQMQNKKRKNASMMLYEYDEEITYDDVDNEERYERIRVLFEWLSDYLQGKFLPNEVDIYIVYYFLKVGKNRISYKKLAEIMDVDTKYITNVIQKIKKYVRSDEKISRKKNELLYENGDFDD